jgi:hypothetical protein
LVFQPPAADLCSCGRMQLQPAAADSLQLKLSTFLPQHLTASGGAVPSVQDQTSWRALHMPAAAASLRC